MNDETKPPRQRGQKEREAAYRAGFVDGLEHAHAELSEQRAIERKRDDAVCVGLAKLRSAPPITKRRRKGGGAPDQRDPEAPTRPGGQGA